MSDADVLESAEQALRGVRNESRREKRRAVSEDPPHQNHHNESPSHLTAISEEFSNLLGDLTHNRIQLIQGEKKVTLSGMAGVTPRRVKRNDTNVAFKSIDSAPSSIGDLLE